MAVAYTVLSDPFFAGVTVAFSTVGAFVATRRPRNPIGWVLLCFGFFGLLGETAGVYARAALDSADPASWLAWKTASVVYPIGWMLAHVVLWMGFLVFPDGKLLSRRWRPGLWCGAAAILAIVALGFIAWPQRGPGLVRVSFTLPGAAGAFQPVPVLLLYGTAVLSVVSLVVRFLRSRGEERLQLKWLVFAVVLFVVGLLALASSGEGPGADAPVAAMAVLAVGMIGLPVSMGIAILRYRLYEIDRIIHRTTVYAIVTTVLGASYFGLVFSLQALLRPLTGSSDLAIAASTLAVAAAFGPVRRRVQSTVDRRFYRRRYDATRVVEGFAHQLRDEVDLDALLSELEVVAGRAVQPAHLSLWMPKGSS